jgi:hypothetical protein
LNKTRGPWCKFHGIKLDFEFFFNRKILWTGLTVSVDHDLVFGSMVYPRRRWPKGSLQLALGVAPVSGSSPTVGEMEKEASGFLPWVRVGDAVPEGGQRRWTETAAGWSSVWGEWRHGEVKQRVG